jgi:2-polyprenyl-3-methyl-5-hydroxy-6-metoxy-1,4-benzoquinol methylase
MESERQRALEHFLSTIDREQVVAELRDGSGAEPGVLRRRLDTYLNECRVGLDLIEPYLDSRPRLLEVGAGIGALSAFLATEGFDIVAIEPAGPGFDVVEMMRRAIDAQLDGVVREVIDAGVDEIPAGLGLFDLVFSVHVLEHVPDVSTAIAAMQRQLAPGGRSVHVCPNYAFPFDPHFGIPLVPGRPAATAGLLPASIRSSGMWRSLNFVTAGRVRRTAQRLDLTVDFRPGVLGEMVDRLDNDPVFRERHRRLVSLTDLLFHRLRLRAALDRWPAGLASPMVFELQSRAGD